MDAPLKELAKLEKLTAFTPHGSLLPAKSKSTAVVESLDSLLLLLRDVKQRLEAGAASEEDVTGIYRIVEEKKKEIDERQKEVHASLARYGKALDKVCSYKHRLRVVFEAEEVYTRNSQVLCHRARLFLPQRTPNNHWSEL